MHPTKNLLSAVLRAVLCLAVLVPSACAADSYYMRIEGKRQGTFKGEAAGKGNGWIQIIQLQTDAISPRDPQSGLPTGKRQRDPQSGLPTGQRQHKPFVVTTKVGTASPQIMRASTTNEPLDVVIQSSRSGAGGKEEVYQTIKLTNAMISGVRILPPKNNAGEEEEISIVYQKIEVTDNTGKTTTDNLQRRK